MTISCLYRALLHCYPPAFRARFGDEITAAFERERRTPRPGLAQAWFLAASLADVIRSGFAQRRLASHPSSKDPLMVTLIADVNAAARTIVRNPRLTVLASLTLALGVTFVTALFSVAHAAFLRPLPYGNEAEVVMLWEYPRDATETAIEKRVLTPANFLDVRQRTQAFSHLGGIAPFSGTVVTADQARQVLGRRVTADVFPALGARPALGRAFQTEEDEAGNDVVILSHRTWRQLFGSDPSIVGRSIVLNERTRTVVGVMAPDFRLPGGSDDVLVPFVFNAWEKRARKSHWVRVVARLKPTVTLVQARADTATVAAALEREFPDANQGETVIVEPIRQEMIGDLRPALMTLTAAVTLVLLIACVNVANLLLANGTARRKEMAVRMALGAGRLRLFRQLTAESVLLAMIGGTLGAAGGVTLLRAAGRLLPREMLTNVDTTADPSVIVVAVAICVATATLFGLVPVFGLTGRTLAASGTRLTADTATSRLRRSLVVLEVALAVVLLTGAGLVMRSFVRLTSIDLGFASDHLLTFATDLPRTRYQGPQQWKTLFDRLIPELEAIPGVVSAAGVTGLPLNMDGGSNAIFIEGRPAPGPNENTYAIYRLVTPAYFSTIRIPIVEGRDFGAADGEGGMRVVAVNQTLAKRFWPGESALGKRLTFNPRAGANDWMTVVAVVGDTHHASLSEPIDIQLYAPYTQEPNWMPPSELAIRTSGDPMAIAATVRERMRAVDPRLPVEDLLPMESIVARSVAAPRFNLSLLGALAATALLLAAIGVYGLLTFSVALRTRELGVRSALGATRAELARMVVRDGLTLVSIGLVAGMMAGAILTRSMSALLFETSAGDPITLAIVAGVLLAVAAVACYVPARRAARVDPVVALRAD